VQNVFFLGQKDVEFTTDINIVLEKWWDVDLVVLELEQILRRGDYDFVFNMLPYEGYHGEHKAATVLGNRAVMNVFSRDGEEEKGEEKEGEEKEREEKEGGERQRRPIVLGGSNNASYFGLPHFPEVNAPVFPSVTLNRTQSFGFDNGLDYRVFCLWSVLCHKSQGGLVQDAVREGISQRIEYYWVYDLNPDGSVRASQDLFERIRVTPFRIGEERGDNC